MFQNVGEWVVEMEWRDGDYQGGPAGLYIRPTDPESPPPGGISSTVLRGINFREAAAELHADLAKRPRGILDEVEKARARHAQQLRDELAKGVSVEYLAKLSSEYVWRVNRGQPKPVERIAQDLGKSLQTVRGHLWQARKQGLLTGSAGRKGGDLTTKAMTLLQQMGEGPNREK